MTNDDPRVIWANPSKDFFIKMLVKDIGLVRAILDLVDNSVDGARRLRGDNRFDNLWVRLEIRHDRFRISDNCGGIDVDLARQYAFRFGRPKEMEALPHSVGQFGVGMKRALFKMGTKFTIESTTRNSWFVVKIDVDEWIKEPDTWTFEFAELEEEVAAIDQNAIGTRILIESLHESVSADFLLENFQNRLNRELEEAHLESMNKGLAITLNGVPLTVRPLSLLESDQLKPSLKEMAFNERLESKVSVKLFSGISASEPSEAGWYLFCNGRMVIGADQTNVTGWGEGEGRVIPKYHNQFARFRGYVFFDADDAGLLPWNTTKTGVDADSPIYRTVRQEMIVTMRPVIDFLNRLDAEKDEERETDEKPLETVVSGARAVELSSLERQPVFIAPRKIPKPKPPRTGRIQYDRPVEEIDKAKRVLKVKTFRDVGQKTFEYFFKRECGD